MYDKHDLVYSLSGWVYCILFYDKHDLVYSLSRWVYCILLYDKHNLVYSLRGWVYYILLYDKDDLFYSLSGWVYYILLYDKHDLVYSLSGWVYCILLYDKYDLVYSLNGLVYCILLYDKHDLIYSLSGWVSLGNFYNQTTGEASPGKGFQGYVSQVHGWDRVVDYVTEIAPSSSNCTAIPANGHILDWTNYELSGAVRREMPSKCNQEILITNLDDSKFTISK